MEQSTKLFLVLGFMFLIYVTMKGNLKRYLQILVGNNQSRGTGFNPIKSLEQIIKDA